MRYYLEYDLKCNVYNIYDLESRPYDGMQPGRIYSLRCTEIHELLDKELMNIPAYNSGNLDGETIRGVEYRIRPSFYTIYFTDINNKQKGNPNRIIIYDDRFDKVMEEYILVREL